nr:hypothetical protein BaRGS_020074 [Batillaria attramentaria]
MEAFGTYFLTYLYSHGHDILLKTMGRNMISFLKNLQSLHASLNILYNVGLNAPDFRCIEHSDGSATLHYYSTRPGLHHIVVGLVTAVGRQLFEKDVQVTIVEQDETVTSEGRMYPALPRRDDVQKPEDLCEAIPYHIVFDLSLRVKQCGVNIQRLIDVEVKDGMMLEQIVTLVRPVMDLSLDTFLKFLNSCIIISIDRAKCCG